MNREDKVATITFALATPGAILSTLQLAQIGTKWMRGGGASATLATTHQYFFIGLQSASVMGVALGFFFLFRGRSKVVPRSASPEGLFTALQIEIFRLAEDLKKFRDEFEQPPHEVWVYVSADGTESHGPDEATYKQWELWSQRLNHAYADEFGSRAASLIHRLGKTFDVSDLVHYSEKLGSLKRLEALINSFYKLALAVQK